VRVRLSAAVGTVLAVLGLVALAVPELTTALPANDAVILVLGVLLVLGGVRDVWRRRNTEFAYAETPDTEQPVELPTPGREFDRSFDSLSTLVYPANERHRLRKEVRDLATETLRRQCDHTETEARDALSEGTWTDDPFAAAFFTGRPTGANALSRLREVVRAETAFQHRARRAIDELYELAEGGDTDERR